jgi:hypothetical protein
MASHALLAVAEYFVRMLIERPGQFDSDRLVAGIEQVLTQLRR